MLKTHWFSIHYPIDQCTADTACTSVKGKPKCDTGSTPKACVQCLANTDCVSVTGKPKCDISNKECIAAGKCSAANFCFNKGLCMIWNKGTLSKDKSCQKSYHDLGF